MSPRRLGAMIRRIREAKRLTQEDLAKKAHISQPYLSQLEAGSKKSPGVKIVQRLAKALGVPVTELLD